MDAQMKIDSVMVRKLREAKSWSQEHLASAAGLSTRTVQRVEADGIGSAETRLGLAGALGVAVSQLALTPSISESPSAGFLRGRRWAWVGWGAGGAAALTAIAIDVGAGGSSIGQAGAATGLVCAALGISAAILGHLQFRARTRGAAA